jgi:hypothetical protein
MKKVKIYLRSIVVDDQSQLMMFDSNRNGSINNLATTVLAGSTIVWKLDRKNGIKRIERIYSKTGNGTIFRTEPHRFWIFKSFRLKTSRDAEGEEAYNIDLVLCNNSRLTIDPIIIIKHP